jgi:hypothetical protein
MMLHNNAGSETLALLRITVFGCWLTIILFFPLTAYAQLPIEIIEFWGIYHLAGLIPKELLELSLSTPFLICLKILLIISCFLCMVGVRPFKSWALFACLLIILFDFIVRGYNGFINHAQTAIFFSAIIIAFYPASDSLSIFGNRKSNKSTEDYSFPVIVCGLLLCIAYSFIGIKRIYTGGFDIFTNQALEIYIIQSSLEYSKYGYEFGLLLLNNNAMINILKIGFLLVTLVEILSPFIFFNKNLRYVWLSVIIPFHFITLITMNIFFWENILLILTLFIKWKKLN